MRKINLVILTVLVVVAAIAAGFVAVAESGAVNIAATRQSLPGVDWFFSTLSAHSIDEHAEEAEQNGEITPPATVTDAMVREGASEYAETCVTCHGGPGVEAGEIGKGLHPAPPDLSKSAREMDPAEIYWVLEHGIRHSGMPAFGPSHDSDELWATAEFVDQLDSMTAQRFHELAPDVGTAEAHAGTGLAPISR
jgi:mono/diheme cytochrome c family protein